MVEYGWLFVGLSALLAGTCVVILLPAALSFVSSMRRTVQIRGNLSGKEHRSTVELLLADLCINGVFPLRFLARQLFKLQVFGQIADYSQTVLSHRITGCNSRAVAELLLALSLFSGLLTFVITQQIVLALLGLFLPLVCARLQAHKWVLERKAQLREQLPDALRGLGMCFMAGLSLEQAFAQTAEECREPLQSELRQTVDDLHTGSSVMKSLDSLDARLAMDDMRFVSVALEIQHRTGGSMREVLDATADSMQASFDLSRSLVVQTAQARLSARVVSIMPLALVVVLSLAMEGYLATFFSSPAGLALLICAIGMQAAGILIIRQILGVNLE